MDARQLSRPLGSETKWIFRLVSEVSQDILTIGSGRASVPGRCAGLELLNSRQNAVNRQQIGTFRDEIVKLSVPYVKIPEAAVVRTRIRQNVALPRQTVAVRSIRGESDRKSGDRKQQACTSCEVGTNSFPATRQGYNRTKREAKKPRCVCSRELLLTMIYNWRCYPRYQVNCCRKNLAK